MSAPTVRCACNMYHTWSATVQHAIALESVRRDPIAAREEAMDEYVEEDDREDIIVEIGSLLTTPRGARDVV
mgnify:CR=1 FL=1